MEVELRKLKKPGPRCRACTHPRRAEIEAELLRHVQTHAEIARQFGGGLSAHVLKSHLARHMPPETELLAVGDSETALKWQIGKIQRQLEVLEEDRIALLKRNPSSVPALWGRIGEHMDRLAKLKGLERTQSPITGGAILLLPCAVPIGTPADLTMRMPDPPKALPAPKPPSP